MVGACWSARLAGIDDPGPRSVVQVNGLLAPAGDAFTLALEASPALPVTVRQLQAIAAGALARNPARP